MNSFVRSRRSARGFTLVEMMVAMVVLGIILLAAIPNLLRANQTHQLNSSVSQIETAMRRARSIAATKRTPVQVSIDVGARTCTVMQDTDDNGTFDHQVSETTFSPDVQLSQISLGGGTTVVFDERGAPDNPGTIVVRTRDGHGKELLISAGSGSVMVLKAAELTGP